MIRTESRPSQIPASRRRLLALVLPFAACLVLGVCPAVALQSHAFAGAFGSPGSGAGQLELSSESGLAVDQSSGDVYVADTGNHRVDEFSESGAFIGAFGWGVKTGDVSGAGLDTCTIATGCQAGFSGAGAGQFENPTFIAVDNTPGGASDVYVADLGTQAIGRQTVTVSATGGTYTLSFTSTLHANITAGSNVVTAVAGRFDIGDAISGPGIPSGTTIVGRPEFGEALTLSANATASGRVVLGVTGATGLIAYNATHEQVQAALENLNSLESSVCVSGNAGGPYTVEFCKGLANTNTPQMTADSSGLTGAAATATVTTAVEGKDTARVEKFDSSGNLIASWGGTPAPGQLDGTTCLGECGDNPRFRRFDGIVVNPDGNPLVLDSRYEDEGEGDQPSSTEWTGSAGEYIQAISTYDDGAPIGLAVDPAGRLYLGNGFQAPPFEVIQASLCNEADPSSPCHEPKGGSDTGYVYRENFVVDPGPATGVAVDPSDEDAYVARFNSVSHQSEVAGYNPLGSLLETFGGNGEITQPAGIAAYGLNSNVYVADPGAGRVEIFAPGGPREDLTVARGGTSLGSVVSEPAGISCPSLCSAGFPENEAVVLTAVPPAHATFVGWSGGGCSRTGACRLSLAAATTVTAVFAQDRPALTAGPVSNVTRHTATLTGTVDPEGDASSCRFAYGPTSAYGAEAPCLTEPGSGVSPVAVSAELWDLTAGSTYHYRVVSANTGGVAYGPDQTFSTLAEDCGADAALCPAPPVVSLLAPAAIVPTEPVVLLPRARALTDAQRLAKTLKACGKDRGKRARLDCEKQARKRYAPVKKKAKKSTLSKNGG